MQEVVSIEPKHLSGKDGTGKGSQMRHGANNEAYRANFDKIFGRGSVIEHGMIFSKEASGTASPDPSR